jgi:1,2-diacylglycerol 3-beta-galactosyltransferase
MEAAPKKILILTADAGFGHRSAALAVQAALIDLYGKACQVDIINPLEDKRTPAFLRDSQSDYDRIVREAPSLYRLGYDASDLVVPSAILESTLTVLLYEVLQDILSKYQPDAILTTYPMYEVPLQAVFTIKRITIPLLAVVTDISNIHRIWFNPRLDTLLVPNNEVREEAIQNRIAPEKIKVTGIPVHPNLVRDRRNKSELRQELGWLNDLTTLLAVGSRRMKNLGEILDVINHYGAPLQLAVVAGKDDEFFHQLHQVDWHIPVHLYDFVTNMPMMMNAADALICKAGGLIVTEALACGIPLMLVDVIPGQETGNMEYVVNHAAGDLVEQPLQMLATLTHWLRNEGELLHARSENSRQAGRPEAAFQAAGMVWQAAQAGPVKWSRRRFPGRQQLLDFLRRNRIKLEL